MEICATIRRLDVAIFQVELVLGKAGFRSFQILMLALAAGAYFRFPSPDVALLVLAIPVIVFVGLVLLSLLNASIVAGENLGKRRYVLDQSGLHELSEHDDQTSEWSEIGAISKTRNYVSIQISTLLFHVIPRRSFKTRTEFESFFALAKRYRDDA